MLKDFMFKFKEIFYICFCFCLIEYNYTGCCCKKRFDFKFLMKSFGLKDKDIIQKCTIKASALDGCIKTFLKGTMFGYLNDEQKNEINLLLLESSCNEKLLEFAKSFGIICCCRLEGASKHEDCMIDLYFLKNFDTSKFKTDNFEKLTVKVSKGVELATLVFDFLKNYDECIFFSNSLGDFLMRKKTVSLSPGSTFDVDFYAYKSKKKKS